MVISKKINKYLVRFIAGEVGNKASYNGVQINCYDSEEKLFATINFTNSDSEIPDARYLESQERFYISFPFRKYEGILDLLRNENPIFLYCNIDSNYSTLSTSKEEVGEGEKLHFAEEVM